MSTRDKPLIFENLVLVLNNLPPAYYIYIPDISILHTYDQKWNLSRSPSWQTLNSITLKRNQPLFDSLAVILKKFRETAYRPASDSPAFFFFNSRRANNGRPPKSSRRDFGTRIIGNIRGGRTRLATPVRRLSIFANVSTRNPNVVGRPRGNRHPSTSRIIDYVSPAMNNRVQLRAYHDPDFQTGLTANLVSIDRSSPRIASIFPSARRRDERRQGISSKLLTNRTKLLLRSKIW